MMMATTAKPGGTLRGYSKTVEATDAAHEPGPVVRRESTPPSPLTYGHVHATEVPRPRGRPTGLRRATGGGVHASTVAARDALSLVMNASSKIEQQLALVEMLFAVGPDVRDRGAPEDVPRRLRSPRRFGCEGDLPCLQ
jgi:hypothetical protein